MRIKARQLILIPGLDAKLHWAAVFRLDITTTTPNDTRLLLNNCLELFSDEPHPIFSETNREPIIVIRNQELPIDWSQYEERYKIRAINYLPYVESWGIIAIWEQVFSKIQRLHANSLKNFFLKTKRVREYFWSSIIKLVTLSHF